MAFHIVLQCLFSGELSALLTACPWSGSALALLQQHKGLARNGGQACCTLRVMERLTNGMKPLGVLSPEQAHLVDSQIGKLLEPLPQIH